MLNHLQWTLGGPSVHTYKAIKVDPNPSDVLFPRVSSDFTTIFGVKFLRSWHSPDAEAPFSTFLLDLVNIRGK